MEVFSRIRLVARERYLELNAEKVISNFARIFKASLVRQYYSKWRLNTYNEVVGEMNQRKLDLEDTKIRQQQEYENM